MRNLASLYLERLKDKLSARSDDELAKKLQVGKSTLSTWRVRGVVPPGSIKDLEAVSGIKYSDVRREFYEQVARESRLIESAVYLSFLRLGASAHPDSHQEWATWLAINKKAVIDALFSDEQRPLEDPEQEAMRLYSKVANNQLLTFEDYCRLRSGAEEGS